MKELLSQRRDMDYQNGPSNFVVALCSFGCSIVNVNESQRPS